MNETERIDEEVERWRAKGVAFAAQLETARAVCAETRAEREAVVLAARAEGDPQASRQLEAATEMLTAAEREVADLTTVSAQIGAKLEQLTEERVAAAIEAARCDLRALASDYVQTMREFQQHVVALVPLGARLQTIATAIENTKVAAHVSLLSLLSHPGNSRDFARLWVQWCLKPVLPGITGVIPDWVRAMFTAKTVSQVVAEDVLAALLPPDGEPAPVTLPADEAQEVYA